MAALYVDYGEFSIWRWYKTRIPHDEFRHWFLLEPWNINIALRTLPKLLIIMGRYESIFEPKMVLYFSWTQLLHLLFLLLNLFRSGRFLHLCTHADVWHFILLCLISIIWFLNIKFLLSFLLITFNSYVFIHTSVMWDTTTSLYLLLMFRESLSPQLLWLSVWKSVPD